MNIITWLSLVLVALSVGFTLVFLYRMWVAERRASVAEESERRTRAELEPLRPYRGIHDVNEAIARLSRHLEQQRRAHNEALAALDATRQEARASLNAEIKERRAEFRQWKEEQEQHAKSLLDLASTESQRILEGANSRAREIAGDAWDVKDRLDQLRRAEIAIRNSINGYGDEYLIPSTNVLDDLADEYDHKEAGRELKRLRLLARDMVKTSSAAQCDYADPYRASMAVQFIVDAFNGKVDSILARAKHDNLGKLMQELEDAREIVNHHGQAFRNARISPEYFEIRRQELRWAIAARELQRIDREEQRAIREAIREEERLKREVEKARRDAEREEKALQEAMRIATERLAEANDAQRAEFEQELEELRRQLTEAEAKEQRAISMAQQTRRGHVYVISNLGSFGDDVYKIGLTRRLDPLARVKELSDASVPFEFDVHAMIYSEDAPTLEADLHRELDRHRVNKINLRKEFFRTSISAIRDIVEDRQLEVHWTMKAEAAEFHESRALQESRNDENGQVQQRAISGQM